MQLWPDPAVYPAVPPGLHPCWAALSSQQHIPASHPPGTHWREKKWTLVRAVDMGRVGASVRWAAGGEWGVSEKPQLSYSPGSNANLIRKTGWAINANRNQNDEFSMSV